MTSMTDQLATVTQLPASVVDRPRDLRFRQYSVEPPANQPLARLGWAIEQQLGQLWDQCQSPYTVLDWLPSDRRQAAADALDAVFVASDDAADSEMAGARLSPSYEGYEDALYALCDVLRGDPR